MRRKKRGFDLAPQLIASSAILIVMLVALVYLIFLMSSCGVRVPRVIEVPMQTEVTIRERLIPVALPADSAWMVAWFECDSSYNVLLKAYNEKKTRGIESDFDFLSGRLNYTAKTNRDTVFVKGRDSIVYQDKPVRVEIPVEVNRLTSWQNFQIWLGRAMLGVFAIGIIVWLLRRKKYI